MQSANNVELGDAEVESLPGHLDNFLHGILEAVRIALLARKRAELAAQDAIIGIIDVAVDDVAGAVADFAFAHEVRDGPEGIQVLGFKEAQGVLIGNALPRQPFRRCRADHCV